jgi:starch phosphorylase
VKNFFRRVDLLVNRVLGRSEIAAMPEIFCHGGRVNMTYLALNLSSYVNGVAKQHGALSRRMFDLETIDAITNGVHVATWATAPFQDLFTRYIPAWKEDHFSLRHVLNIPLPEIWNAHQTAKRELLDVVQRQTGVVMKPEVFTVGFARRVATCPAAPSKSPSGDPAR